MFQHWSVFEEGGVSTMWIPHSSSKEERDVKKKIQYYSGIAVILWSQFIRHSNENYALMLSSWVYTSFGGSFFFFLTFKATFYVLFGRWDKVSWRADKKILDQDVNKIPVG